MIEKRRRVNKDNLGVIEARFYNQMCRGRTSIRSKSVWKHRMYSRVDP